MFLLDLAKAFQGKDIDFVILGGYAVALHGVVRGTVDIDLAVALTEESFRANRAEVALHSLGLQSRLPLKAKEVFQFRKEYAEKRNLLAWSFVDPSSPMRQVDILILKDSKKIKKTNKKIHGVTVPIASIEDLIKIKEEAGRPQDLEDVKALKLLKDKNEKA